MSKRLLATVLCAFLAATVGSAQKPDKDISAKRHPNLAAAQRLSRQAWEKVVAAQQANEWDMNGHPESQGPARPGEQRAEARGRSGQRQQEVNRGPERGARC